MGRPADASGFTLIELLVVIGIIGVLITLLVPTVSMATAMVREHRTRATIKELEVGIEAFKADFGLYPPSRPRGSAFSGDRRPLGQRLTGAANLAYYLLGPAGAGWGIAGGGLMPFGNVRPSRSYGPYAEAPEGAVLYDDRPGREGQVAGFLDAYTPSRVILYFAGGSDANGDLRFYWRDNNGGGTDPSAKTNYASEDYFEQCVKETLGKGANAPTRYWRQGYYLVSPGLDGRYGAIQRNENTGEWEPVDLMTAGSQCDDVGNWLRRDERY